MPSEPSIVISTVLCSAHVDMAIDCLGSVERFCVGERAIRFRVHDDGSLSEADCERLAKGLSSDIEFVLRERGDELMRERLRSYPELFDLRDGYPPALKMLDAPLFGEAGDSFVCIDGDILFLRPLVDPFAIPADSDALFMNDRESNYSLRSWQLFASRGLRLPARVNVGIIAMRRAAYDLDYLNWFVAKKRLHHGIPWVVEQTAWAGLGFNAPNGCRVLDPERVRVMREGEDTGDLAIGHFTGRTRHLLPGFVTRSRAVEAGEQEALCLITAPVKRCRSLDLLGYEARRIIQRFAPEAQATPPAPAGVTNASAAENP